MHSVTHSCYNWWLTELPYWLKVTFLLKNLGILTMRGEKIIFSRMSTYAQSNLVLRDDILTSMSHQSDYSLLDVFIIEPLRTIDHWVQGKAK